LFALRVAVASMSHCVQFTKIPHGSCCVLLSASFIAKKHVPLHRPNTAWILLQRQSYTVKTPCFTQPSAPHAYFSTQSANKGPPAAFICARLHCRRTAFQISAVKSPCILHATHQSFTVRPGAIALDRSRQPAALAGNPLCLVSFLASRFAVIAMKYCNHWAHAPLRALFPFAFEN